MKHFTTLPKFRALMGMTLMAAGTLCSGHLLSQDGVSINTSGNAPATSAALDVDYADKGVLIPRIALTGTSDVSTIPSPATSLLVYNNGSGGLTPAGFYYWNGSAWTAVGGGGGGGGTTINCSSPSEDMTAVYNNGQWECNDVLEIDPTWNAVSINSFGGPSSSYELLVDGDTYITDGLRVGTTTSPPSSGILSSGDIKINTSSNSFVVGSTNITGSGASYISNGLSVGTSSSPPSNGLRTYGDIQAGGNYLLGSSSSSGTNVVRTSSGYLRVASSTIKVKENIKDLKIDKEQVFKLHPVSFNLKPACGGDADIGLIAEEVEKVVPDLVIYGPKRSWVGDTGLFKIDAETGREIVDTTQQECYSVRYDKVGVYLVPIVAEQDRLIQQQQTEIADLKARLDRQESQIARLLEDGSLKASATPAVKK